MYVGAAAEKVSCPLGGINLGEVLPVGRISNLFILFSPNQCPNRWLQMNINGPRRRFSGGDYLKPSDLLYALLR